MAASSDGSVGEIKTMGKADDAAAMTLLKRVVGHVLPIMRKRSWKVGRVTEFFPANANLLGLNYNRGEEIRIRLRPADHEKEFLPFESLVGTMLHELTHIVHGPHDARFYKLLDELTAEYDVNVVKGLVEAEGFVGAGVQLGGRAPAPPAALRGAAAAAAEKRRQANLLLGQAPQRLGSAGTTATPAWKQKSPGLMAAEAAERRLLDQIWCGNRDEETSVPLARPAAPPAPAGPAGPAPKRPRAWPAPSPSSALLPTAASVEAERGGGRGWDCPRCTYVNRPLWLQCGACGLERVL